MGNQWSLMFLFDFTLFVINIHQIMLISLFPTPFDHFYFHQLWDSNEHTSWDYRSVISDIYWRSLFCPSEVWVQLGEGSPERIRGDPYLPSLCYGWWQYHMASGEVLWNSRLFDTASWVWQDRVRCDRVCVVQNGIMGSSTPSPGGGYPLAIPTTPPTPPARL